MDSEKVVIIFLNGLYVLNKNSLNIFWYIKNIVVYVL